MLEGKYDNDYGRKEEGKLQPALTRSIRYTITVKSEYCFKNTKKTINQNQKINAKVSIYKDLLGDDDRSVE